MVGGATHYSWMMREIWLRHKCGGDSLYVSNCYGWNQKVRIRIYELIFLQQKIFFFFGYTIYILRIINLIGSVLVKFNANANVIRDVHIKYLEVS